MASFAEERRKKVRAQKAGSTVTSGNTADEPRSFREERIRTINIRNKSKAKMTQEPVTYNTKMFEIKDHIGDQLSQMAAERAARIQAGEKKAQQLKEWAATANTSNITAPVTEPLKTSREYLWGTEAWKNAKERERQELYDEALKRFQTDPQAVAIADKGQGMRHGLPEQAYLGDEARYLLHTSQTYYMTPEERDVYNYILAVDGEKSAKEYLKYLDPQLNERATGAWKEAGEKIGEEMPGRAAAFNAFAGSVAAPTGYLYALAENLAGNEVDHNSPRLAGSKVEQSLREGIKENKVPLVGEDASDFLIDTGLSMAQNVARLPLGYAGLALAAGGAATSGYLNAIDRGGSEGQALWSGAAQGAAEALFEKFSLEGVESLKAMPPKTGREFLKNILRQGAVEGSEEIGTEFMNSMTDLAIMKELSQISTEYQQNLNNGESESAAAWNTAKNMIGRLALAGAGGALSGGIMGGGAQALGTYMTGRDSHIEDYQELAESIDAELAPTPEQAAAGEELRKFALELAEKQQNGDRVGNFQKGALENAVNEYIEMSAKNEAVEQEPETISETDSESDAAVEMPEVDTSIPEIKNAQNLIQEAENVLSDEERTEQVRAWAEPFGANGRTAFEEAYDQESELPAYSKGFANYYNAGRYNMEMSEANKAAAAALLTPEQATAAYKAGALDRNAEEVRYDKETGAFENMTKGEEKTGGLVYADAEIAPAQKQFAGAIGKRTGLKFKLVNDIGTEGAVASYEKGVVQISANAKNFNAAMSHELTHFIQDYSPDMYQLYQDQAVKAITKAEGVDVEALVNRTLTRYEEAGQKLSREQAMDEIVADATERFFNDPEYIDQIVKENRTLGEKFLDFIEDVIDAIKSLIQTGGSRRQSAQALEQNLEMYESARTYWMTALQEAGDRYKAGWELEEDAKERYSLAKPDQVTADSLEENYDYVRNMEPIATLSGDEFEGQRGVKVLTEAVMKYYNTLGNQAHNDVVGDILLSRRSVKDDIAHGYNDVKAITFKAVPEVLEKGKVLQFNKDWKARGYDTAVIGGKIKIAEGKHAGDYYQVCVVKVDANQNRMYLHEVQVIKTDGNIPFKTWTVNENGLPSGYAPSIYSIFDKLTGVNEKQTKGKIRFQLEGVDDYEADTARLIKENQELQEANALLKKQFELTSKEEMRQSDIRAVSRKILKEYGSSMKAEVLDRNLTRLYEYIRSAENVDTDEVSAVASDIARSVLNQSQKKDTSLAEQYKDLRKQLRETKIMITDQDKKDLASMGGYNEFRKKYFGRMKLSNDGISVDTFYQELAEQHPDLFSADVTHPADQLLQIGNVLDLTQPHIQNPYHANMDEIAYIVGQEILSEYTNIRNPAPTFADRKQAELERVKREYQEKAKAYREKLTAQYKEATQRVQRDRDYNVQWKDAELYAQRDRFNQNLRRQQCKKGVIREVGRLRKWLLEPTDKQHVPQELRKIVAEFLNDIDFSSNRDYGDIKTQRTQAWIEASAAFRAIINGASVATDEQGNAVYMDIDPDMAERIEEIRKKVEGIDKLDDLDAYHMEELQKVVISMKKALTEVNAMRWNAKYGDISLLSEDVFRYTEELGNKKEYLGWIGKGEGLINYDMVDPQTMFGKMGPAMKSTYDALRKGLDVKTIRLKEAADYFEQELKLSGVTIKDIRKWTGVNAPTQVFELSKGKIELSIPQIMSLYELQKRGQASKHIYNRSGGIKADDLRTGISWDNKSVKIPLAKKSYRPVKVTEADVEAIIATLTDEQKKLADALQKFMGDQVSKWGNEVSMEMYGYEKFTAKNYFPIVTDKNYIMQPEGTNQGASIKNMGITKNTNRHANNPVIIEDIFEVFTRQVDQMSSYNAYVIPLSDLHKVMNYKDMRGFNGSSIKEELERTFGKAGVKYINKLVEDINGSIKTDPDIGAALLSNMKAASVAGNLRVAVQQPTSIARAVAEIDAKYLAAGVAKANRDWDTITKYAPVAQWKDWGFYKMQTERQMKDVLIGSDSAKQRAINKSMFLATAGDKIAWKHLWGAVECEISEKYPELEVESEEFLKTVGERFSEIVDRTQVADSILHRTQIMRSNNGTVKMATSFMAEPLKTYNMMYRAFWDAKTKQPGGKKRLARSATAYVASAFLTAVAAAFVDAMRDDDREKEYWQKYSENFIGNVKDNVNALNSIPYVKDIISTFKGYTPKRTDIQGFQDLYYAMKKIDKLVSGESNYTPQYVFMEAAKSMSSITGIPIKSVVRDAVAIIDTAVNAAGGEADYEWLKMTYDINASGNQKMYVEQMMQAENSGNGELAKQIRKDLTDSGMTEADFDKKINTVVNGMMDDEGIDIESAALGYDSKNAESKKTFEDTVRRYIALKSIAGWDKKKCLQQVRSILTGIYKAQYQAAKTQSERDAIIRKCKSYYYDGESIYKDYKFATEWKK